MIRYGIVFSFVIISFLTHSKNVYEKEVADFNAISFIGRFTAEVIQGDEYGIKYFIDDPEIDTSKISFSVENEILTIRYSGGITKHADLHFEVIMPKIKALHCKSGAELKIEKAIKISDPKLSLTVRYGGKMLVRYDQVDELFAKISQGGAIRVIGETEKATYEVYTGGSIAAVNNEAKDVYAKINFGGEIICTANENLEAKVTSGGTISYKGDPKLDEKVRIAGNIEKL